MRLIRAVFFVLALLFSTTVQAAIHTVTVATDADPAPAGSLREAVEDAVAGDTIEFAAALDGETISLVTELEIDKKLIIDATDRDITLSSDSWFLSGLLNLNAGASETEIRGLNFDASRTIVAIFSYGAHTQGQTPKGGSRWSPDGPSDLIIEDNTSVDAAAYHVMLFGGSGHIIRNNTFTGSDDTLLSFHATLYPPSYTCYTYGGEGDYCPDSWSLVGMYDGNYTALHTIMPMASGSSSQDVAQSLVTGSESYHLVLYKGTRDAYTTNIAMFVDSALIPGTTREEITAAVELFFEDSSVQYVVPFAFVGQGSGRNFDGSNLLAEIAAGTLGYDTGTQYPSIMYAQLAGSGLCLTGSTDAVITGNTLSEMAFSGLGLFNAVDSLVGMDNDGNFSANAITNNDTYGVFIDGAAALRNQLRRNAITGSLVSGIYLLHDANGGILSPVLSATAPIAISSTQVGGSVETADGSTVEIFDDISADGATFLAEAISSDGLFSGSGWTAIDSTHYYTATVTDADGNTSAFSDPMNSVGTTPSGVGACAGDNVYVTNIGETSYVDSASFLLQGYCQCPNVTGVTVGDTTAELLATSDQTIAYFETSLGVNASPFIIQCTREGGKLTKALFSPTITQLEALGGSGCSLTGHAEKTSALWLSPFAILILIVMRRLLPRRAKN